MTIFQYTPIRSLRKAKDRVLFSADLRRHVLAVPGVTEDELRRALVDRQLLFGFEGPEVSASIWMQPDDTDWLISWYGAKRALSPLPGVWESVNQFHFHKATSFARSLDDVIRRLVDGFTAANYGRAFQ